MPAGRIGNERANPQAAPSVKNKNGEPAAPT
jgi:hypothetical protein